MKSDKYQQIYYKNNRLQQLRGFIYTAQNNSISKAAKKINLSQSAITLQIQSLERDLKIKLFKKDGKKLKLTNNGKDFYKQCINHVQGLESLFENFSNYHQNKRNNIINIGANHASISYILPKYLKKFRDKYPNIKFQIRNLSRKECSQRLLNNEIDFFVYPSDSNINDDEFDFIEIAKYQVILITKKDHPLVKIKDISLSDITKYEVLKMDPELVTLPSFQELMTSNNVKCNIEFERSDWEILKKFVKSGIAITLISNIILEGEDNDDLVEYDLTKYFPEMSYGIFLKKGRKPIGLLEEFLEMLKTEKLLQKQQ